ncbi:hypothetical protein HPB49_020699 [Dermacentor silvarum]|uniref:Uncharacterized protein n=1 Tax=Dermacentor silvarum TaxID=543639 RepID=A0ACB8C5L0_DERSI|nr:hypothetical protein HPB49_020699 [Dermacentor silvarum]
MKRLQYSVVTSPIHPTRIGNSDSRDTTPDLTLDKLASLTEWHNTCQTFGSDDCILQTLITAGPRKRVVRTLSVRDWDAFRARRVAHTHLEGPAPDLET